MAELAFLESHTVLFATLNKSDIIKSIRAAINYYKEAYGDVHRVWVNGKDVPDDLEPVEGFEIEKRGGCQRNKVMVM
jgi:hypothetical protein